jgi:ubiquinone/menaquinone biosynthesis C-methylase UbiE
VVEGSEHSGKQGELFDTWAEGYDAWFATPIGQLVKIAETDLLLEMLAPQPGERLLDVGCGTGIFTREVFAAARCRVVGLDISLPMLTRGLANSSGEQFFPIAGDMLRLPFADDSFCRVYSMTALEFVDDARAAIVELQRVCRPGGTIVLTTLNSLSPWATIRQKKGEEGHSLFSRIIFRSPQELAALIPGTSRVATAVHFDKEDTLEEALRRERQGQMATSETGAFLALCWQK